MVLDEVWRRLDGVQALSGPHGGPLRRTVNLILDPLVIRPVQNPLCAGSILSADGAVLLTTRLLAAADVLCATAAWFTLLKQVRRALRITEGNAQDLYFQRCFELATVSGLPDPVRDRAAAEAALREIHDMTAGRTTQALKEYLADPEQARELGELIATAWRRRPLSPDPDPTAALAELLEACAAGRLGEPEPEVDIDDLAAAYVGTHSGIRLWRAENGDAARELGLTAHELPRPPGVGGSASKASLGLPFDRTIHERVFTVLQASSERAELPPIPELVTAEVARACSPWSLLDESLRVAAAAGSVLAAQLRPIDSDRAGERDRWLAGAEMCVPLATTSVVGGDLGVAPAPLDGMRATDGEVIAVHGDRALGSGTRRAESAAARVINARWQREAYVLQARRLVVRAEGASGPLETIAAELRVPWRVYSRRLWVRLHGRDVREFPVDAPDELWDVLDGVARSVILDHRTRVKRALATTEIAAEPMESRAG
ncbi:hypothetical protein [Nocardia sp. NPDC057668]|uniref:hypothetical protein n=1 Tax=Nocardia sp. NPDC057668 TaxID=3346202 RepID=UPI0036728CB4